MKAAIYARYSSSGQREESIEGQVRECTDYAQKCGYDVVRVYSDKALTGRTDKRPEFQRMIADAERRLFDVLICWKIDRFARNRYDSAIYKNRLHKAGVSVQYARETISDGAEGIILESVLEGFAEYYSANLAENVKRGNYESMSEYKTLGKKYIGLKTDENGRFAIDESTAPIVKEIFERYAAGDSIKSIYEDLNRRGFRNQAGRPFNKSSLQRILANEKYCGIYVFKGFRQPGAIPAIIPPELFEACRKRAEKARHAPKPKESGRYILTGKLYCGYCGGLMTGETSTSATGRKYQYYVCQNRKGGSCSKKRVHKEEIETRVVSALIECVHDDSFINEIADAVMAELSKDRGGVLSDLERKEAAKQKEIENMLRAIAAGLDAEKAVSFIDGLEAELAGIRVAIAEEKAARPDITRGDVIELLTSYRQNAAAADPAYIQRLIDSFLVAVYLYDNDGGQMILNTGTERKINLPQVREQAREACLEGTARTAVITAGFVVIAL